MELPIIRVVHPAYHSGPNLGLGGVRGVVWVGGGGYQGSFFPSASLLLSCVLVFANSAGYVIA